MGRPLNPDELEKVKDLIRQNFVALAIRLYGVDSIPKELLDEAVKAGKITQALIDSFAPRGVAGDAYLLGYEQHAHPERVAQERPEDFAARADTVHADLSDWERRMARQARMKGAQFVVGLGNEVADDFTTTLISSDNEQARETRRVIAEATATSIEARESWRRLRGTLGEALGEDWARNLHRIAATEIQAAVNAGIADAIEEEEGHEAQVAVIPNPDACEVCLRFYLQAGKPRIYRLADLPPHGVNFKKPKAQWVPCLPPSHPWCFPAGTPVLTARGPVAIEHVRLGDIVLTHKGRWRPVSELRAREYTGELVDVKTGIGGFSSTPNHEALLVDGRWRCAGHIEPGLDLVHAPREVTLPHPDHTPPSGVQERSLDPVLFAFLGGVVPVAAVHLDGEHLLGVGEVDQVASDLIVRLRSDPGLIECGEEENLQLGKKLSGCLRRPELDGRFRVFRPASGGVGGPGYRLALGLGCALVSLDARLARAALLDSSIVQDADDHTTRHADRLGNGQHGFALMVSPEDVGVTLSMGGMSGCPSDGHGVGLGRAANAGSVYRPGDAVSVDSEKCCEHGDRVFPRLDEPDDFGSVVVGECHVHNITMTHAVVESCVRHTFAGLVYNIGVVEDHSYVAGGVAVHNCHCQLVSVPDGWTFDDAWVLQPPADPTALLPPAAEG